MARLGSFSAYAQSLSGVQLFSMLWTVALQAPLSMGFPRHEYWKRFPCSPPGDLPNSGLEPEAPALQADSLLLSLWRSPLPSTVSLLHF